MSNAPRRCRSTCDGCLALQRAVPAVVAQVGIRGVTIDDLAGAVGMTPSAARRHAPLDQLIAMSYCACAAQLHERLFSGLAPARASWAHGLRHGLAETFVALNDDPARTTFCFQEVPQGDSALRAAREGMRLASLVQWRQHHLACAEERAQLNGPQLERLHGALLNRINVGLRRGALHELDDSAVDELVALAS